jgi:hypothetical protein
LVYSIRDIEAACWPRGQYMHDYPGLFGASCFNSRSGHLKGLLLYSILFYKFNFRRMKLCWIQDSKRGGETTSSPVMAGVGIANTIEPGSN